MATSNLQLPDEIRRLAEQRAAEAGCATVEEYVTRLIQHEAVGAPAGLSIDSDEALEALVKERLDGPWVVMDEHDFRQIRRKLEARLEAAKDRQP